MRLVSADFIGSFDDYSIVERQKPEPGAGEVRIAVRACGVGYVDGLLAKGGYQVKPETPYTPGGEISGVIDAVGAGVSAARVGERVLSKVKGAFAEFAISSAEGAIPIPERLDFAAAATMPTNYCTALHALADRAAIRRDEKLLVLGAAGGVGIAAVQIGALLGAEVIACASTEEKRAFALSQGASSVIDTELDGWRDRLKALTSGSGPHVVFDPVCGSLFEPAFRSLGWRGRHLVVGFVGGPIPKLPANLPLLKGAALVGVDYRQLGVFEPEAVRRDLDLLLRWAGEGRFSPPISKRFAFEDFRHALAFGMSGQGLGKAVLEIA